MQPTKKWTRKLLGVLILEMIALSLLVALSLPYALYPYPMQSLIEEVAEEYHVPPLVLLSTMKVESNFKADAISPKGAIGLMQIMPETFEWLTGKNPQKNPYCAADNVEAGAKYLAYLYDKYGSWDLAHAAYNAGDNVVDRWLSDPRYGEDGRLIHIPYKETENYLRRIRRTKRMYTWLYCL